MSGPSYTPHHEIVEALNAAEIYFADRSDITLDGPNEEMRLLDSIRRIHTEYDRVKAAYEYASRSAYESRKQYDQLRERTADRNGVVNSYTKAA